MFLLPSRDPVRSRGLWDIDVRDDANGWLVGVELCHHERVYDTYGKDHEFYGDGFEEG